MGPRTRKENTRTRKHPLDGEGRVHPPDAVPPETTSEVSGRQHVLGRRRRQRSHLHDDSLPALWLSELRDWATDEVSSATGEGGAEGAKEKVRREAQVNHWDAEHGDAPATTPEPRRDRYALWLAIHSAALSILRSSLRIF